jgi:hypothetical protein
MEETVRWVVWLLLAFPGLVLWLPRFLGFM